MSKSKSIVVALLAVLALNAVIVSVASADTDSWFVGGTKLTKNEKLLPLATVDLPTILSSPEQSLKVTCSGGASKVLHGISPLIEPEDKGQAQSLVFLGCSEIEPANCTVTSTIETEPVAALADLGPGTSVRVLFTPKTPPLFTTLSISGSTCSIAGDKPVKGAVTIGAPTGKTENIQQAIEGLGSVENNSLEVAGHKAFLQGGYTLLSLESMKPWSFHL
jgi:hypothetical protein